MKQKLAILGATGHTGKQALRAISKYPNLFTVEVLSTDNQVELISKQAKEFQPNAIVVTEVKAFEKVKNKLSGSDIKVFSGQDALCDIVSWNTVDIVIAATTGFSGIRPIIAAIEAGKRIAIANNEVLAAAGQIIREKALANKAVICPVSPSLSAIFQSLVGEQEAKIKKVILTATGGPFLDRKPNYLVNVKKDHALQFLTEQKEMPEEKAIIDISTLMDKGMEMMAAGCLFGLNVKQLDIVIHPQSVLHSMTQFNDGTIKTQIGSEDIQVPLLYALTFPKRLDNPTTDFLFSNHHKLTFLEPDFKTFRSLFLAKEAMKKGHNAPCMVNAANEVVVSSFINNKINFLEMSSMIEEAINQISLIENPTLEDLEMTDQETRKLTRLLTKNSQLFN